MEGRPLAMSCTAAILVGVMLGIEFESILVGPIVLLLLIVFLFGAVMSVRNSEKDGRQPLLSLALLMVLSGISVTFGFVTIRYFITSDLIKMFTP